MFLITGTSCRWWSSADCSATLSTCACSRAASSARRRRRSCARWRPPTRSSSRFSCPTCSRCCCSARSSPRAPSTCFSRSTTRTSGARARTHCTWLCTSYCSESEKSALLFSCLYAPLYHVSGLSRAYLDYWYSPTVPTIRCRYVQSAKYLA